MLYWEDLEVGQVLWGDPVSVDRDEMLRFAKKNDPLPIHLDEDAALRSPHNGLIASGGYTVTLWFRSGIPIMGNIALIAGFDWHIRLPKPARPGDTLRLQCEITARNPSSKPGRGTVTTEQVLFNGRDEAVMEVRVVWMVARHPPSSE